MKSYIILIILNYIQLVFCSYYNISEYDYPVCPISLFRRKRAQTEYTRWRANQDTTQEFILKILDDYVTTPDMKKVVAVNIQSVNKGTEKIIVGGVMVPPPAAVSPAPELGKEYTRFVPPTTVPVTRIDGELLLAPASTTANPSKPQLSIIKGSIKEPAFPKLNIGSYRNPKRDESPPAGPQFLTRMPVARQYAPVAPVAFTQRATLSSTDYYTNYKTNILPTRTIYTSSMMAPLRTTSHVDDQDIIEDLSNIFASRTTFEEKFPPTHSTTLKIIDDTKEDDLDYITTASHQHRTDNISEKYGFDKSDSVYHMFYNEDKTKKKDEKGNLELENYEDKNEFPEKYTKQKSETVNHTVNEFENRTEDEQYVEENEDEKNNSITLSDNSTPKETQAISTSMDTKTIKSVKDKIKNKRRRFCSMLKLRQLNFNTPRTLPEIIAQMKQWAEESPVAKWVDITDGNLTTMENPIYMMIVDDPSSGQIMSAKQTVMVIAGIQGRDQYAVSAAMYVLYQLIERSENHADLLTKYRFWVIPVFNPDGYDYSLTFPHRREWSKNLRQYWEVCKGRESCRACHTHGLRCTVQPCYGVNLDRNFEYQWIPTEELRSEHTCGELYAGTRQLSESETKALTHFLHEQRTPLFTFIAFKEGDVLVLCALHFFGTGSYQTPVGNLNIINISQPSSSRCISEVVDALNHPNIFHQYVKYPNTLHDLNNIALEFHRKYNFPGVIGCIDCTHVSIVPPGPPFDERSYVNRKNYHSINTQLGVMYPYSHTRKKRAFDHVYRQRASRAASAAYSISGRPYVAGQTSEFLPLYAGGIEDWVDGHLGIDNTYTVMMFRPRDSYNSKLMTEHVVHEAYVAMDTLLLQSLEPLRTPIVQTALSKACPINSSPFIIILVSIWVYNR